MPVQIVKHDITSMDVDIIVNPTDCMYSGSGGVDYQIHKAAGPEMTEVCSGFPLLSTGDVQITPGFDLQCKYVIHTVGPVWEGGINNEEMLLRSCYINALIVSLKLGAKSVAFPLISSGTFGFPKDKVMRLATLAISDFLYINDCDMDIYICVIDRQSYELAESVGLSSYLEAPDISEIKEEPTSTSLVDWLKNHDDSFAVTLLKLIDKKGMTDVECYKKANISRKTFSKINTDKNYKPSKQTAIAFAIALELNLEETEQLLKTVGFSLSHSNTFDLIIEFCINEKIYDVLEINEILYKYDQVCLGC